MPTAKAKRSEEIRAWSTPQALHFDGEMTTPVLTPAPFSAVRKAFSVQKSIPGSTGSICEHCPVHATCTNEDTPKIDDNENPPATEMKFCIQHCGKYANSIFMNQKASAFPNAYVITIVVVLPVDSRPGLGPARGLASKGYCHR